MVHLVVILIGGLTISALMYTALIIIMSIMKHHEAMYITVFAKLNVHQFPLHSDNRQTQYRPNIPRSKIYDRAHSQGLHKHSKCWPL